MLKFSADQERDDHGRFASGGGSGGENDKPTGGKSSSGSAKHGDEKKITNANRMVARDMLASSSNKNDEYATGAKKLKAGDIESLTPKEKQALRSVLSDVHGGAQTGSEATPLAQAHYASVADRTGNSDLLRGGDFAKSTDYYATAKQIAADERALNSMYW